MKLLAFLLGSLLLLALALAALWRGAPEPIPATPNAAPELAAPAPPAAAERAAAAAPPVAVESSAAAAPDQGALTGTAVDVAGAPLAGARVRLLERAALKPKPPAIDPDFAAATRGETATDALGGFRFDAVATGPEWDLLVEAAGFARTQRGAFHAVTGRTVDVGPIALVAECRLSGRVLDERGAPLPGASVEARSGPARFEAAVDAAGAFEFRELPAGDVYLKAVAAGFIESAAVQQNLFPGEPETEVVLRMRPALSIRGRVVDGAGAPLARASVSAHGPAGPAATFYGDSFAETGDDGRYSLDALEPGVAYTVSASSNGYGLLQQPDVAACTRGVDFALARLPRVLAMVQDAATGEPIAAARAGLHPDGGGSDGRREFGDAGPGADGRIALPVAEPGVYTLRAEAPGYGPATARGIEVTGSGPLDFGPYVLRLLRSPPEPALALRVVGADGAPVAGARVQLRRASETAVPSVRFGVAVPAAGVGAVLASTTTDSEGAAAVPLASLAGASALSATASHADHGTALQALDLTGANEIVLYAAASLEGRVLDTAGEPARALPVVAWHASGASAVARTDGDGHYRFHALAPGSWRAAVGNPFAKEGAQRNPAREPAPRAESAIELAPGARARLDFDFRGLCGAVRGRVTFDGAPRLNRRVLVRPGDAPGFEPQEAWTDDGGAFAFPCLLPGRYRIELALKDGTVLAAESVAIEAGRGAVVDFALATGRVRGRVFRLADGSPVAGHVSATLLAPGTPPDAAPILDGRSTAEDGTFRLVDLPEGHYRVAVRSEGRVIAGREVEVAAGAETELSLPLELPGTVELSVSGIPEEFGSVMAFVDGAFGAAWSESLRIERGAGSATISLQPGAYRVRLEAYPGGAPAAGPAREFALAAGGTSAVALGPWPSLR